MRTIHTDDIIKNIKESIQINIIFLNQKLLNAKKHLKIEVFSSN